MHFNMLGLMEGNNQGTFVCVKKTRIKNSVQCPQQQWSCVADPWVVHTLNTDQMLSLRHQYLSLPLEHIWERQPVRGPTHLSLLCAVQLTLYACGYSHAACGHKNEVFKYFIN